MIASPCTNICLLDPRSGWCLGCGRTLAEIGAWPDAGEAERSAIVARLPARMKRLATPPQPG